MHHSMHILAAALLTCGPAWPQEPHPATAPHVRYALPAGWRVESGLPGFAWLRPPGYDARKSSGETYGFAFDETYASTAVADGDLACEKMVAFLEPGLTRRGAPVNLSCGALDCRYHVFTAKTPAGVGREARVYGFALSKGAGAFFAIAAEGTLAARGQELGALLGSLELPASASATSSKARRIAGGTALTWNDIAFDIPRGWQSQSGEDGALVLHPPGFDPQAPPVEYYTLAGDGSVQALEGDAAQRALRALLDELFPGLRAKGGFELARFGDVEGATQDFEGQAANGQVVLARAHAFRGANGAAALVAIGIAERFRARDAELKSILGSFRTPARAPAATGATTADLVGTWQYYSGVSTYDGGRATTTELTLGADGTYAFYSESASSNPLGGAGSSQTDRGTWSLVGAELLLSSAGGGVTRHRLQKQNHPKTRDPMIVLNGQAFVTKWQKAPWR